MREHIGGILMKKLHERAYWRLVIKVKGERTSMEQNKDFILQEYQENIVINQFRAISLCNACYKIIAKIVVHRLKSGDPMSP
ncbi:hypothetical protein VNO77_00533 [Canavalia gladiata]|uniref:Uncharacterized protein n=1 Tax=Canavalia gladiata TaxID=3824 RepID=A0AAN9MU59_CANGL